MRIAIVDPGSFVLPYDFQLVKALAERKNGAAGVDFFGSLTRYNAAFLEAMRHLPHVTVLTRATSSSVASRWRGALAYLGLLGALLRRSRRYATINLQFSAFWPIELPLFFALRGKFVFTVHNAVPHGFMPLRHRPTQWLAASARSLVFVSDATRDDFMRRYGDSFRVKSSVLPHGVLPIAPDLGPTDYTPAAQPRSLVFWSTVRPYKGVELFADLARCDYFKQRGLALEIFGAWAGELRGLRQELVGLGVAVHDEYLGQAELLDLLGRDAVFLLPYREASQSGALYSLLNHGRLFICADVGDLGAFMRRFGLEGLLLRERSARAVAECLTYLDANRGQVIGAFRRAQRALRWSALIAEAGSAYRAA